MNDCTVVYQIEECEVYQIDGPEIVQIYYVEIPPYEEVLDGVN